LVHERQVRSCVGALPPSRRWLPRRLPWGP
jgi:hypothetical protein